MRRGVRWSVTAALLWACGGPLEVTLVGVNLDGVPVVSPANPGEFTVTVQNTSAERITWGMGSSSCQLSLIVIADNVRHRADFRACTDDLGEQGLNPGETRVEVFSWGGHVPDIEGQPFLLPDGRYRVVGAAGTRAESRALWVRVAR